MVLFSCHVRAAARSPALTAAGVLPHAGHAPRLQQQQVQAAELSAAGLSRLNCRLQAANVGLTCGVRRAGRARLCPQLHGASLRRRERRGAGAGLRCAGEGRREVDCALMSAEGTLVPEQAPPPPGAGMPVQDLQLAPGTCLHSHFSFHARRPPPTAADSTAQRTAAAAAAACASCQQQPRRSPGGLDTRRPSALVNPAACTRWRRPASRTCVRRLVGRTSAALQRRSTADAPCYCAWPAAAALPRSSSTLAQRRRTRRACGGPHARARRSSGARAAGSLAAISCSSRGVLLAS